MGWYILAAGLDLLVGMGVWIVLTRWGHWPEADLGTLAVVLGAATLVSMTVGLGFDRLLVVELSRMAGDPAGRRIWWDWACSISVWPIAAGLLLLPLGVLGWWLPSLVALYGGLFPPILVHRAVFQIWDCQERDAALRFLERGLQFAGAMAVLHSPGVPGIAVFLLFALAGRSAAMATGRMWVVRMEWWRWFPRPGHVPWGAIRQAAPFAFSNFAAALYLQLPFLILGSYGRSESAAYYKLASLTLLPLGVVFESANVALLPRLTRVLRGRPLAVVHRWGYPLAMALLAVPIAWAVSISAQYSINLFGAQYAATVAVLQVLAWMLPLQAAKLALAMICTAHGLQWARVGCVLAGCAVFTGSLFGMLSREGNLAPAWATLISEGFVSLSLAGVLYWRSGSWVAFRAPASRSSP